MRPYTLRALRFGLFTLFIGIQLAFAGRTWALDFPRPNDARRLLRLDCNGTANPNGQLYERVGPGLNNQDEGMLAWFEVPDGSLEDMAECYNGHHFNWFQQVVEPDGYGVRMDGTPLTTPFIDPPLGGFGDDPLTTGDDSLWADNLPWYWNEQPAPPGAMGGHEFFPLERHVGPHPVFGSPMIEMIDFPSRPTSVASSLKFETYLVAVDLAGNNKKTLYLLEWTWAKSAGSNDSLAHLVRQVDYSDIVLFDPDAPASPQEQLTWEFVGMGLGEMITTPAGTQAARLVSGDEISMEAIFDTPGVGAFNIGFDYWFQTTEGTLDVLLDGQVIHTISAPNSLSSDFFFDSGFVYDLDLRGIQGTNIAFRLNGANSEVWLDDIVLTSVVPEPTAIGLLLSCGILLTRRSGRVRDHSTKRKRAAPIQLTQIGILPSPRPGFGPRMSTYLAVFGFAVISAGLASFAPAQVWDGGGGNTNWHSANNWNPNGVPTTFDTPVLDASLSAPVTVDLSANVFDVFGLMIADGFRVDTHGFALFVNDFLTTALTEITGAGSELIVSPIGNFDTDRLLVRANGRLNMQGGFAGLDFGTEIRANGSMTGHGDVVFGGNSSPGVLLDNKGNVSVTSVLGGPFGGTLSLSLASTVPAGASLSLSGSTGTGTLTVNDNSLPLANQSALRLVVDGETEDFEGVLDIGKADSAEFVHDLNLLGGRIEFNGNGGTATLTGTGTLSSIGGFVNVNSGTARIDNIVGLGIASTLSLADNTNLVLANTFTAGSSGTIDVGDGATIQFDGTASSVQASVVNFLLHDNSQLIVHGNLTIDAGTTSNFDWDGSADNADTLVEGANAVLSLIGQNLDPNLNGHDGDLTINNGGLVQITTNNATNDWEKNGTLSFSSAAAGPMSRLSMLSGTNAYFIGAAITATGDGTSVIEGNNNIIRSGSTITVAPGATLRIKNSTIEGGTWGNGNGTLQNSVAMNVATSTTMNFETVDLDGPIGEATVTLNSPVQLHVAQINQEAGNVFGQHNGTPTATTLTVNPSGRLDISAMDLASANWRIGENATVDLFAAAGGSTQVSGADVHVDGSVQVLAGTSRWDARTTIASAGDASIAAGASWTLAGGSLTNPNRIEGGRIIGGGTLRSGGNTGLHGFGIINTDVNFNGFDRELLAAEGTLNVNGTVINVGRIGTANAAGKLNFGQSFNTQVAIDALVLNGGMVSGSAITNGGTTRGFGSIKSNQFVQGTAAGVTTATTGQLTIDVLQPTVAVSQGTLNAVDGDLTFVDPLVATFDGTVNVGSAMQIEFQSGWNLSNGGQLNFVGGSGNDEATVAGDTIVNAGAVINVTNTGVFLDQVTFGNLAQVNLPNTTDILLLEGDARIPFNGPQTATLVGSGILSNQAGSLLIVEPSVNSIGVDLRNRGTLELGQGVPGTVGVTGDFVQFFSGTTNLDIAGNMAGTGHDRFVITGNATLDGTFAVTLGGGFSPSAGASFDLLDFATAFGTPSFSLPVLGGGLAWDTSQFVPGGILTVVSVTPTCDFDGNTTCDINDINALLMEGPVAAGVTVTPGNNDQFDLNADGIINNTDVDLWLANAGSANGFASPYKRADGNLDGVVDGQDFILWNLSKFTSSLLWDHGEFNGDGVVDGQDFILWNGNKFTSSDAVSAVPEPTAALLSWASLIVVCLARAVLVAPREDMYGSNTQLAEPPPNP